MDWDLNIIKSQQNLLGDHHIYLESTQLKEKKIALLLSGTIAAYQVPEIIRYLRHHGAQTTVFCSENSLKFVTPTTLYWCSGNEILTELTALIQHIPEKLFDLYMFIPSTYNTINKCAKGIADNIITSTFASALGYLEKQQSKIIFFPTMHESMYNLIAMESLKKLQSFGCKIYPPRYEENKLKLAPSSKIVKDIIDCLS